MANRLVSVDESYRFPTPLEARLAGAFAGLVGGVVPAEQLPAASLASDSNVSALVDAPMTGAAIDERINIRVTPVVEQITADYIAGDQAVIDAAAAAVDANPKIAEITKGTQLLDPQLNNATETGRRFRQISNANATAANNCPFPYIFELEVFPIGSTTGTNLQQVVWGASTFGGGIAVRSRYNGNWTAWDIYQTEAKTLTKVQGMINSAVPASAKRTFPITLSFPGSTSVDTRTSVQVRVPIKLPATTKRWRVHLRNRNDRTGTVYPGALSLTGVGIGKHLLDTGDLTGNFDGAPTTVSGAATTPANGDDWVSPWSTYELKGYGEYLLSYGFTCSAQDNHAGYGAAWTTGSASDVMVEVPAGAVLGRQPLLDVWIEAEFDAEVPAVAYFDSSSGVGIGAKYVGRQSYANVHALAHGVIPVIYAHSGSAMRVWNNSTTKDQKWASLSKPDALYWGMGGNDLSDAGDLATMQQRFYDAWPIITAATSTNVHLGTLTARYGTANTPEFTALRQEYNAWLETLPGGAVACWDRSGSVSNDTDDSVLEKYAALPDTGHLNEAGYARSATAMAGSFVTAVRK